MSTLKSLNKKYKKSMNYKTALLVKKWRVEDGMSWKMIHEEYIKLINAKRFSISKLILGSFDKTINDGNFIDGMLICYAAQDLLGENIRDEWYR